MSFRFNRCNEIKISILGEIGRRKDAKKFQMVSPPLLYITLIISYLYKYLSIIGIKKVKKRYTYSLGLKRGGCILLTVYLKNIKENEYKNITPQFSPG